ncbi:MAG: hypothetical protein E4H10_13475, partial [Bacteroidia bacterium]
MNRLFKLSLTAALLLTVSCQSPVKESQEETSLTSSLTVKLFADNPRYLEYQGEPVILITSAEHYGAVLNLDFDYQLYLETLGSEGFN